MKTSPTTRPFSYDRNVRREARRSLKPGDKLSVSSDRQPTSSMEQMKCTTVFLSIAIFLDIVGLLLFLIGVFTPNVLAYWDFFVFSGPLLIFLSLVLWIFWYTGNLTVSEDELDLPKSDIL